MTLPTTPYSRSAIALHWIIALMILCLFVVGLYMVDLKLSPQKLKIYSWHKWGGVTVFLLALLRVGWRATHEVPPPPATMPAWQASAANVTHAMLYVLIFAVPLTGWLSSSALGFQTVYFGILPLPDLLTKDKGVGEGLEWVHSALNFTMAGFVLAHAGAALKHHWIDRDDVLTRMLPFLKIKQP